MTGAYAHIPFCAERCEYCAFALWTDRAHLADAYIDAICAEIDQSRREGVLDRSSTVYLGGGTPSVLPGAGLARLIAALAPVPDAEVTVECNPESTTPDLLDTLAAAGVTRISLGVQSTDPVALAGLGRPSPEGSVPAAVRAIGRSGIGDYGVDLVYGAAGETDRSWRASLHAVLGFDPAPVHVSVYALTVEPGTVIARTPARHPDEETLARRYGIADEVLSAAGLSWYEISNFARPGHESRHNMNYWSQGDYLGFGASADSHLDGHRFRNVWHIDRYLDRIAAGRSPRASEEILTPEQRRFEALLLALRTRVGVAASELDTVGIEHLVDTGGERVVLNRDGRMLADAVALRLRAG